MPTDEATTEPRGGSEERRALPPCLRCPEHCDLEVSYDGPERLACPAGCAFEVLDGIPRFVPRSGYADAFGLQWNAFRWTQLDSHTGTSISRDRLTRCLGGDLSVVDGRTVLEVGCGAGRFTEILLGAGAHVIAADLSSAIDANAANVSRVGDAGRYFPIQADVRRLPIARRSQQIVVSLGMVQHTPSPEQTIAALADAVAPGGQLVLDHYGLDYALMPSRRVLRAVLIRLPPPLASRIALAVSRALLRVHRLLWREGPQRYAWLRSRLRRVSPLVDYYDSYRELGSETLGQWAILDTHDTLTDRYKHLRSLDQVRAAVDATGLRVVEARIAGNGVEVRAVRDEA